MLRRVPPAHSPLPFGSLLAATKELLRPTDAVADLETLLRAEYRSEHVLLLDSGTQALSVAIRSAIQTTSSRSEVALPAYSCYDVAAAAVGAGAERIHFYDLNPRALAPDLSSLERILGGGVQVAVVAPLFGIPVDWDALEDLASRHGALLIEDAAQGYGAEWRGNPLGSLGALSILSFGRGKGWTGTRGGAALGRNGRSPGRPPVRSAPRSGELRSAMDACAQSLFARPSFYSIPSSLPFLRLGETVYHEPSDPAECNRVAARILTSSRGAARREARVRRENGTWLLDRIENDAPHVTPIAPPPESRCGFLRLPVLLDGGMGSLADAAQARRLGISSGYPRILPELPAVRTLLEPAANNWTGARDLVRTLVTVPTHSGAERERVARILKGKG